MKNVLKLTEEQVVELLQKNVSGTEVVTVDLDSDLDSKMRKRGNPFVGKGLVKRETLNGMIGYIYSNSVNKLASKEGKEERQVKRHPWGDMDKKHLFRIHRKTHAPYLSMKLENSKVHGYFLPDGTEVRAEEVTPFISKKKKSSTQSDLDGEVIALDYAMRNIQSIRMRKAEIQVVH